MSEAHTMTLELTVDEINAILAMMSERPYKEVYELFEKIGEQGRAQLRVDEEADTE